MRHLLAILVIYTAIVVQTTIVPANGGPLLHWGTASPLFPAMALLIINRLNCGLLGLVWSGVLGLLCDALSDGRLGTLMLVAVWIQAGFQATLDGHISAYSSSRSRSTPLLALSAGLAAVVWGTVAIVLESFSGSKFAWSELGQTWGNIAWREQLSSCGISSAMTGGWMFCLIVLFLALRQAVSPLVYE